MKMWPAKHNIMLAQIMTRNLLFVKQMHFLPLTAAHIQGLQG